MTETNVAEIFHTKEECLQNKVVFVTLYLIIKIQGISTVFNHCVRFYSYKMFLIN